MPFQEEMMHARRRTPVIVPPVYQGGLHHRRRPSGLQSPKLMDHGIPPAYHHHHAHHHRIQPTPEPPLQRRPSRPAKKEAQKGRPSGDEKQSMRFERIRKIGEGGEGEAWLMRSVADNSLVVRKVCRRWKKDQNGPFEAKILCSILPAHKNILNLYYFSERPEEQKLHMYYAYCSGGSLESLISKYPPGSLPESFLWHAFIQLAEALEVVHHRGTQKVVHRDVKPDNIFLAIPYSPTQTKNSYPSLVLGDFGLATLSSVTSGSGTYMWMGPEVPEASAKGDIWSLGATIHAMALGQGPVDRRWPDWATDPQARRARDLPDKYSNRLNNNMLRCLRKNPDDRISSQELVKKLKQDRTG